MNGLLMSCNKVSKEAFDKLAGAFDGLCNILRHEVSSDVMAYSEIEKQLNSFGAINFLVVGDIFWPTGQNVCRWCKEKKVLCFFWQHGQWIYTKNKKNPRFLPTATFFLGGNIKRECSRWGYGKRSKLRVTGSPRYDGIERSDDSDGPIYFSPPVINERSPSVPNRYNYEAKKSIAKIMGLDDEVDMVIQPHYREGSVDDLRSMFPRATFKDPSDDPITHILNSGKVLTHKNSTVILDAIACGKQSVTMNLGVLPSAYPEGYFGKFVVESESPDHCLSVLNESIVSLPHYYETSASEHILLGNASKRMTDYVMSLV